MKKILIIIFLLTISCSNNKVVNNHGFTNLENKSNKIEVLKSNKSDVLKDIGTPSTISLFDENIWFYIERSSINQSIVKLGKSKLEKNNILQISFDNQGLVKSKKLYQIDNMNDLQISKETTTKAYDTKSYIDKVLTSIKQKVDAPKRNR